MFMITAAPRWLAPPATAAILALLAGATLPAWSKDLPPVSPDGLKLVRQDKVAAVYVRDGTDFGHYDKVAILDCYVAFKKDWQQDQNEELPMSVTEQDVTRIKTDLADEFKKVFSQELTKKGETVVTSAAPDVLVLRPAIINLVVNAPDNMQPDLTVISGDAGQMTLYLELYDSVSSKLLARVIDPEAGSNFGSMMIRDRVTNSADADRVLRRWADLLGSYLDKARARDAASAGAGTPQPAPAKGAP